MRISDWSSDVCSSDLSYGTRDCSGFVSEIYRSFGVQLPRNTSAQSVSPALNRLAFDAGDSRDKRMEAASGLQVGDLVYIPGHVMMVIGHDNGMPYVIHDTNGGSWLGPDGPLVRGRLNGVSVTPLTPLRYRSEERLVGNEGVSRSTYRWWPYN